ncbi:MAG: LodA/GoxA family CTQ-dependent oxidase, partial [Candidatus Dormibacteraceae bacterium]
AWVIATDPAFAPQISNIITLWDDIYDTWVRGLNLRQDIFDKEFHTSYRPHFDNDLAPIFRSTALQRWTTNLPAGAIAAHDVIGKITARDQPRDTILTGLPFIRDPNNKNESAIGPPFMPLSVGDAGAAFLNVTVTQYFLLTQWNKGLAKAVSGPRLGPGELLDKAVLVNCLGGRFAPGMEMTFIVRDMNIYRQDWRNNGCGPFRLRTRELDYTHAQSDRPFLTGGYVPLHPDPQTRAELEPGDVSKFMAIPWQVDYNSCATHNVSPNPGNSTTLYWSWPAQRPVQVYRAQDVRDGTLGNQHYSVRGKGTYADDLGGAGRYQELIKSVLNWCRIGIVI